MSGISSGAAFAVKVPRAFYAENFGGVVKVGGVLSGAWRRGERQAEPEERERMSEGCTAPALEALPVPAPAVVALTHPPTAAATQRVWRSQR